jgi:hypothetical protein
MKKFFKEHSWWLGIIPVALLVLVVIGINVWGIYDFFKKIWDYSETTGMFILNIVKIPFAIFGGIQLFRGFWTVGEKDTQALGEREYWKGVLYFFITIAGYVALFSLLKNI